ncbi:PrsW family intramembrane metalloprotease [bacterium]|nr:PrsW family intramembrane metalloprotease [bacterium]
MSAARLRSIASALIAALLLLGFARLMRDVPWPLLALSLAPAAIAAAVVLRLDRRWQRRRRLLLGAFLWGAVAAPAVALLLNRAARAGLGELAGAATATWLAGALAAPAIEEIAKAAALAALALGWRGALRDVRDGIVVGALIGIGFTMAENLYYFALAALAGGAGGLAESVYLRAALGGLLHPTFTATAGAGFGWAPRGPDAPAIVAPLLGLLLAIGQHLLWNAVGAPWLNAAPCGPAAAACGLDGRLWYWLVAAPAIVALFLAPGLIGLALAARRRV